VGEHWFAGATSGAPGDEGGDETEVSASLLTAAFGSPGSGGGADAHPKAKSAVIPIPNPLSARALEGDVPTNP
jgi:hypothetical protein